jgi:hypothetical protein
VATVASRWGEHGARPTPLGVNADLFARIVLRLGIDVECTAFEAWALVADIARIGEFSSECIGARWIGGYETATVGAQFEGINRKIVGGEQLIWIRPCTVVIADSGRTFGFVVGDRYSGTPASHWLYQFHTAATARCRIDVTFRHLRDGQSGLRRQADADPQHAAEIIATRIGELEHGVRTSLERMKIALQSTRR